jgi:precorrin-6B methylase 2
MAIWTILAVIFILFLSCEYFAFRTGVPTVAALPSARHKIIEILKNDAEARPQARPYTIIDLGSGTGGLTAKIARAMPYARVTGIEISPVPWLISVLRQKLLGPSNLEYKRIDFWPHDCSDASAVVVYLTENIIERVSEKLRKELPPGTLVIANDVPLRAGWQPASTEATGFWNFKVYVYRA